MGSAYDRKGIRSKTIKLNVKSWNSFEHPTFPCEPTAPPRYFPLRKKGYILDIMYSVDRCWRFYRANHTPTNSACQNYTFFSISNVPTDFLSQATHSTFENNFTPLHIICYKLISKLYFYTYNGLLVNEKNEVPLLWNLAPSIFTFCKVLYFLAKIQSYLLYCLYFHVT